MMLERLKAWHGEQSTSAAQRAENWRTAAIGLLPTPGAPGSPIRAGRYVDVAAASLELAAFHAEALALIIAQGDQLAAVRAFIVEVEAEADDANGRAEVISAESRAYGHLCDRLRQIVGDAT